ncbi:40S ribosomal protein [Salix suchowensis]|nr:40S ribosomal protein [Salix suchowensis]
MMLAAEVHLGTKNCDFQMERYVFKRRNDGIYIINLGKTWEKLLLAARVIVAIENPQDMIVQFARPYGKRDVLKFAQYTGAQAIAGRHTPGTFTIQIQTSFSEPLFYKMILKRSGTYTYSCLRDNTVATSCKLISNYRFTNAKLLPLSSWQIIHYKFMKLIRLFPSKVTMQNNHK